MEINKPSVLAEVEAVFARYEEALVGSDAQVLIELFYDAPTTIRYGGAENLYGIEAVRAYRLGQNGKPYQRQLKGTVITTYGDDFAIASTLFYRDTTSGKVGRQMQSWVRMPVGWRVVAAHVSTIDEPS